MIIENAQIREGVKQITQELISGYKPGFRGKKVEQRTQQVRCVIEL